MKVTSHCSALPSRAFIADKSYTTSHSEGQLCANTGELQAHLIIHVDSVKLVVQDPLRHCVRSVDRVRASRRGGVGRAEGGDDDTDVGPIVIVLDRCFLTVAQGCPCFSLVSRARDEEE